MTSFARQRSIRKKGNGDAIDAQWLCVDDFAARNVTMVTYQKRPAFLVAKVLADRAYVSRRRGGRHKLQKRNGR